jgi:hypothetical protein
MAVHVGFVVQSFVFGLQHSKIMKEEISISLIIFKEVHN